MDREQQVASERDKRDIESDKGAEPHAGQNEEGRKTVTTMVDKIAIGWPFYPAISRQAAIHRIAKPLDYIANERHSKPSGRQADRKSVVEGKSVYVRVDVGGCRYLKTKRTKKRRQYKE